MKTKIKYPLCLSIIGFCLIPFTLLISPVLYSFMYWNFSNLYWNFSDIINTFILRISILPALVGLVMGLIKAGTISAVEEELKEESI